MQLKNDDIDTEKVQYLDEVHNIWREGYVSRNSNVWKALEGAEGTLFENLRRIYRKPTDVSA